MGWIEYKNDTLWLLPIMSLFQIDYFYSDPLFPKNCPLAHSDELFPVSVQFDRDYENKFIIHRAWGGGLKSLYALKYFKLVDYFFLLARH